MIDYKVGDLVVAKGSFDNNELFELERISSNGEFYDTRWRKLHLHNFRHATQEEIIIGRRLP